MHNQLEKTHLAGNAKEAEEKVEEGCSHDCNGFFLSLDQAPVLFKMVLLCSS